MYGFQYIPLSTQGYEKWISILLSCFCSFMLLHKRMIFLPPRKSNSERIFLNINSYVNVFGAKFYKQLPSSNIPSLGDTLSLMATIFSSGCACVSATTFEKAIAISFKTGFPIRSRDFENTFCKNRKG